MFDIFGYLLWHTSSSKVSKIHGKLETCLHRHSVNLYRFYSQSLLSLLIFRLFLYHPPKKKTPTELLIVFYSVYSSWCSNYRSHSPRIFRMPLSLFTCTCVCVPFHYSHFVLRCTNVWIYFIQVWSEDPLADFSSFLHFYLFVKMTMSVFVSVLFAPCLCMFSFILHFFIVSNIKDYSPYYSAAIRMCCCCFIVFFSFFFSRRMLSHHFSLLGSRCCCCCCHKRRECTSHWLKDEGSNGFFFLQFHSIRRKTQQQKQEQRQPTHFIISQFDSHVHFLCDIHAMDSFNEREE